MVKPIPTLKKSVNNATAIPAEFAAQFVETSKFPDSSAQPPMPAVAEQSAAPASEPAAGAPADNLVSLRAPRADAGKSAPSTTKHSKSGRAVLTRAGGAVVRKTTVYLSPDLDRRLAMHAFDSGLDRSEVVATALERYLRSKE